MMKKKFIFVVGLIIALCLAFRWLAPENGYPSYGSDYASHLNIIHELRAGHFFPEWNSEHLGQHSVARWLPIYHGILGAHLLALLLMFFGASAPQAMLVLTDLSLLSSIVCVIFLLRKFRAPFWAWACVSFLLVTTFISMMSAGFYSQWLGLSLGFLFFVLWGEDSVYKFPVWWLSVIVYPDLAMLTLPVFGYVYGQKFGWKHPLVWICGIVFSLLIFTLIRRFPLRGGAPVDFVGYGVFLLMFCGLVFSQRRREAKPFFMITTAFAAQTVCLLTVSYLWLGRFSYYSKKPLFWTPVAFCLAVESFRNKTLYSVFFFLLAVNFIWDNAADIQVLLPVLRGEQKIAAGFVPAALDFAKGNSLWSNDDEHRVQKVLGDNPSCHNGLFLPRQTENSDLLFVIQNSYTHRFNQHQESLDLRPFLSQSISPHGFDSRRAELEGRLQAYRQVSDSKWILYCQ